MTRRCSSKKRPRRFLVLGSSPKLPESATAQLPFFAPDVDRDPNGRGHSCRWPSEGVRRSILDLGWLVCHTVPRQFVTWHIRPGSDRSAEENKLIRRFAVLAVAAWRDRSRSSCRRRPHLLSTSRASPVALPTPTEIQANVSTPGTLHCINCVPGAQAERLHRGRRTKRSRSVRPRCSNDDGRSRRHPGGLSRSAGVVTI